MVNFAIVENSTLRIASVYNSTEKIKYGGEWGDPRKYTHVEFSDSENGIELNYENIEAVLIDNQIVIRLSALKLTEEENNLFISMRAERNRLLQETDWINLKDTSIDIDKYNQLIAYRQQLRDLPNITTNPRNVSFPSRPFENVSIKNTPQPHKDIVSQIGVPSAVFYRPDETPASDAIVEFRSNRGGINELKAGIRIDGKIYSNGDIYLSDETVKENIRDSRMDYMIDVNKLKVRLFNYVGDDPDNDKRIGFLAQELQQVFPKIVEPTVVGNTTLSGIKGDAFIPILIRAVQEIDQIKITNLQNQIDALTARIQALENI